MELVKRKLSDLKPAEYNPRKILKPNDFEYQSIAASIEEFGYVDPIIINSDNTIIGGHQRRLVMLDLGYTEADCVLVNMDKTKERALNIALNKISGEWDEEALKNLLIDLDKANYNLCFTGFEKDEIEELFANVELAQEANEDDYDLEKNLSEITEIQTHFGDIWQMGRHRLMCGDATNIFDIKKLMCARGGVIADLIITDPPYNVDYENKIKNLQHSYKTNQTRINNEIQNDRMNDDAFYNFLYKAFCNYNEIAKQGCPIYIFHSDKEGINFRTAMNKAGF